MAKRTWLQLSQALRREAGVQGDGPSAVTNQTGMYDNLVSWIQQAAVDVESLHDNWRFMHGFYQITPTVTATRDYTITAVPKRIEPNSVVATLGSVKHEVTFLDWSLFQEKYRTYVPAADQPPAVCTLTPAGALRFADYTTAGYTIDFEYVKRPVKMTLAADTPNIPEEFELITVYRALMDYGLFYNAPEAVQHGQIRYEDLLARLKDDQMIRPTVKLGSFLNEPLTRGVSRFL
jgi:hypothetical protein